MTSAVLSNINKPQWVETHRFNPNPHFNRFPNPNPNPNCNFTQKIHVSPHPNLRPLPPPPAIPSVTSSFHGDYVTYDIALYSKRDLKLLKNRLISELQQVRTLLTCIEFKPRQPPRPPPPLPAPPPPPMSPTLGKAKRVLKRKRGTHLTNRNDKVLMKKCVQILTKLMKEKHGWVFNTPVDTLALRLHDYHDIIKRPMDLGTVKSNLDKNRYKSPLDFAADVRLTFENAMVYNPKGLDVHAMAETLLLKFEQSFNSVYQACKAQRRRVFVGEQVNHCKKNDDLGFSEPTLLSTPQQPQPQPPPTKTSLVSGPAMTCTGPEGTTRWVKLGKPKAKDVNKRGMSLEEKGRLRVGLQNLPGEKVDQALMIIHKRNNFTLDGDKIELDFEVFDNETLWELDRFLSYHPRALSKMKREGLIGNAVSAEEVNKGPDVELTAEGALQKSKKMDDVDEDVDIGEEIPVNNYPPIEIEQDGVAYASSSSSRASSSCSSSSDSNSSSSDTDLGSSSESDDDDDERVQAPAQFVESKEGSVTSSH